MSITKRIEEIKKTIIDIDKICGFTGNLHEVWEHAIKEHNVKGHMNNCRLDGYEWSSEAEEEGGYVGTGEVLTYEDGNYVFMCCETHKHKYRKLTKKEKEKTLFSRDLICKICGDQIYK